MEKAIFKENESEEMDQYVASIELSNKCREFYHRRLESAESMKQRLSPESKTGKKSSLDLAFEKLGKEMSSLMDQDLSLMKQLLMLNESIEELKWKRRCSYESVNDSSCDLDVGGSDWSVSDTDMFGSDLELDNEKQLQKNFSTNDLTTCCSKLDKLSTPKISRRSLVTNNIYKQTSIENQNSNDSGIHDGDISELES